MTESDWIDVRREDDDEVIGYLRLDQTAPAERLYQPLNLFGYPLRSARSRGAAVEVVYNEAMASLAETWLLKTGDSEAGLEVVIRQLGPDYVIVAPAAFAQVVGAPLNVTTPDGPAEITLPNPTTRLSRR